MCPWAAYSQIEEIRHANVKYVGKSTQIIQNDMLVGAITHVFVNDPQKGYAIFAENMLEHVNDLDFSNTSLEKAS